MPGQIRTGVFVSKDTYEQRFSLHEFMVDFRTFFVLLMMSPLGRYWVTEKIVVVRKTDTRRYTYTPATPREKLTYTL